jgi:hypothetical protein
MKYNLCIFEWNKKELKHENYKNYFVNLKLGINRLSTSTLKYTKNIYDGKKGSFFIFN